jgi:hypothetical protein
MATVRIIGTGTPSSARSGQFQGPHSLMSVSTKSWNPERIKLYLNADTCSMVIISNRFSPTANNTCSIVNKHMELNRLHTKKEKAERMGCRVTGLYKPWVPKPRAACHLPGCVLLPVATPVNYLRTTKSWQQFTRFDILLSATFYTYSARTSTQ